MEKNETELKIISLIDKIRPFLVNDGGNLEFIKYEDNIVYVRLSGACKDCSMIDITLKVSLLLRFLKLLISQNVDFLFALIFPRCLIIK